MKKIYIAFGVILLALLVIGCSGSNNASDNSKSDNAQPATTEQAVQTEEQPALTILDSKLVKEEYGGYSITGTAKANKDLGYAQVDAQFKDANGVILQSSLANVQNLKTGDMWSFKVIGPFEGNVGNYSIAASKSCF
ncbi:MAG: FxLYD domain-containing protein [Parabacteroides sp.]|nr:FxLYD domain-containing protein [Parabacteroides sp.]